jgi:hypothetical protein
MAGVQLIIENQNQIMVLEELRKEITSKTRFGITMGGPYLTLRWGDKALRQVTFIAIEVSSGEKVLGYWPCKTSPRKMCAYDADVDVMHDDCIYCGCPEERK